MDYSRPMQSVDPRPISTPGDTQEPYQRPMPGTMPGTMPQHMPDTLPHHPSPYDVSQQQYRPPPPEGMGLHLGPEAQIPDHPGSTYDIPRPPTQTFTGQKPTTAVAPAPPKDLRNVRANCLYQLREYMALQNKTKLGDVSLSRIDLQDQMRNQAGIVVLELKRIQADLREVSKKGAQQRWKKLLIGAGIVSFIPIVRRIFRRPANTSVAGNDTEYAWHRAAALLQRIKDGILGNGSFAIIASFVAAVLYVFQNEVKLRVARTIRKRVRKLCARLEAGDETVGDEDLKVFDGWRWKIVL